MNLANPQRLCFFLALGLTIILAGCASNHQKNLQIRHAFDLMEKDTAQQKFDFEMTWFVPPAVLFGNEKNSIIANMGLKTRPQSNPSLSINNQTRLRLEDIAVKRLENELIEHDICHQGYEINQTNWMDRSIRFIGRCLAAKPATKE